MEERTRMLTEILHELDVADREIRAVMEILDPPDDIPECTHEGCCGIGDAFFRVGSRLDVALPSIGRARVAVRTLLEGVPSPAPPDASLRRTS
jgi:hypothetical protein